MLLSLGRTEEALDPLLRATHELLGLRAGDRRKAFDAARRYGRACLDVGRLDEAEQRLEDAIYSVEAFFGPQHPDVRALADDLALLYERLGRAEDLSALRGLQELSYKLRDAGVAPAAGGLHDEPLDLVPLD